MNQETFRAVTLLRSKGYTWPQIAESLGYGTSDSIRSAYRRARDKNCVPEGKTHPHGSPLRLPNGTYLVLADLHAPYTDIEFMKTTLERVDTFYDLDAIIIAGDMFDFGSLSKYARVTESEVEEDMQKGGQILAWMLNHSNVVLMPGNHDERFATKLNQYFPMRRLVAAALADQEYTHTITTTEFDYIYVGSQFLIGHLSRYSVKPGFKAFKIGNMHRVPVTLVGHDHIRGVYFDQETNCIGASIGCMTSTNANWYAHRRLNEYPDFQKGYAVIEDDNVELFDDSHKAYFYRLVDNGSVSITNRVEMS